MSPYPRPPRRNVSPPRNGREAHAPRCAPLSSSGGAPATLPHGRSTATHYRQPHGWQMGERCRRRGPRKTTPYVLAALLREHSGLRYLPLATADFQRRTPTLAAASSSAKGTTSPEASWIGSKGTYARRAVVIAYVLCSGILAGEQHAIAFFSSNTVLFVRVDQFGGVWFGSEFPSVAFDGPGPGSGLCMMLSYVPVEVGKYQLQIVSFVRE